MEKSDQVPLTALQPWLPEGLLSLEQALAHCPLHWHIDTSSTIPALIKTWTTTDFTHSLHLLAPLVELSATINHHPDIRLGWGYFQVRWCSHDLGGIHNNDMILAHITDALLASMTT